MTYETVIGLEIHTELSTKTKAFCACEYKFGGEVNTQCCPGCAGMPGALPVLNKRVVDYAMKMGLACGCKINKTSAFDRKNYFYPDLPGGYQVTQNFTPICEGGGVEFFHAGEKRTARLTRIHIEEDTAKLLHGDAFDGTLIDFNRAGVPLIEIVTEPDFRSGEEVKDFLESLRTLLLTLDICNCKMQEGAIRCDINVSVRPAGQAEYGTRVEMKNVNTFSGAILAIEYEASRQIEIINGGGQIFQETRRWDEQREESVLMRSKENAADYRYFPEANLVQLVVSDDWIAEISAEMPELPIPKLERYKSLGVPAAESHMLIEQVSKARFFEAAVAAGANPKNAAVWTMGHITARLNKVGMAISDAPVTPADLAAVLEMIAAKKISIDSGKLVIDEVFDTRARLAGNGHRGQESEAAHSLEAGRAETADSAEVADSIETVGEIVERLSLAQVSDEGEIKKLVAEILAANEKSVEDYKNGKKNAFAFLVGQCMKASKGKANPQVVNELIREALG
ncbi:MAG: Asp-tRNA(Asn)/Glu-tRNA(Gln) amidotransferase subunit GatB [Defluviitaleaceae bacterium]|nr:Asp-tRNA(Asn)/Glu-tRNA(Gln) amidotransferase subunit GatB [Defluviitaleaceae bacterium]